MQAGPAVRSLTDRDHTQRAATSAAARRLALAVPGLALALLRQRDPFVEGSCPVAAGDRARAHRPEHEVEVEVHEGKPA